MNNENRSEEIGAETVDPRIIEQIENVKIKTVEEAGAIADLNKKVTTLEAEMAESKAETAKLKAIVENLVEQLEKTHQINPLGPEESWQTEK